MNFDVSKLKLPQDKEGLSVQFEVVIAGHPKMVFNSCEGLESEVEVVTYPEGGSMGLGRTARGKQTVGKITFSKGMAGASRPGGSSVLDWFMDVCDASKPLQKKMIVVRVIDSDSRSLGSWQLLHAWPCRWLGPLLSQDINELTVEHLTFVHEGIVPGS